MVSFSKRSFFQEIRRQASWHERTLRLSHFRDRNGMEVDIIIELGATAVAGVEVKAAATVSSKYFRGLKLLANNLGECFVAGVVLYDGEAVTRFGPRLYAVPIRALWEDICNQ